MKAVLVLFMVGVLANQVIAGPRHLPVPGGIAVIPIRSVARPDVQFDGHPVMVIATEQSGEFRAIIGLPLGLQPGTHAVTIQGQDPVKFAVANKTYESQHLTIKNQRQVNPDPEDMKKIARDRLEMDAAFTYFNDDTEPAVSFIPPATGVVSSTFGLTRFFNDQPRNPHSGLDIAGASGSPIIAPAAGRVAATGQYFFNGNTVLIDHGQGLITMYCHMQRIDVAKGDLLDAGDQLGTIGQTGRVTGPHLHWSVSLNNARVDPLLFLDQADYDPKTASVVRNK